MSFLRYFIVMKVNKNKHSSNKLFLGLFSLFLIVFVFTSGYLLGNLRDPNIRNSLIGGQASASNGVDLNAFWRTWELIDSKYIPASSTMDVSSQEKIYGAIEGMVSSLGDPYTVFLKPKANENFKESIQGNFSGVGMEVGIQDGVLTVISPLKNTPAEKSGVQSGDVIVEIDGLSTRDLDLDLAVSRIRGEVGTEVVLNVFRENEDELIEISILRDTIDIPVLATELRPDGVFVISLYTFSANASSDFRKALREFVLSESNELILDLRGNPGGYLDAAVDIASWFLPAGKVIVQEDFGTGENKNLRSKGYNVFNSNLEMVVLVNKGSASASEILAGALQEYEIATLVGVQTFGKGSVQELISVTPDTSLKVTIARWLTPFGRSISDGGLTPDVIVEELPEGSPEDANIFDYQFERALEILNK
jgi:carboxyl-terminal processing protease